MTRSNDQRSELNSQAQLGYGWDNGIALNFTLPIALSEQSVDSLKTSTPRLGGGSSGRAQIDGLFRFWGDAADYIGVDVGVGLPFQSDTALQNSALASFSFPVTLLGRINGGWIAIQPKFTDTLTAPTTIHTASNSTAFFDSTNRVVVSASVLFYPSRYYSPSITYIETFPTRSETGTDQGANTFIISSNSIERQRTLSGSVDLAPSKQTFVISLTASYFLLYSPANISPLQISGKIRWVF